MSQDPMPDFTAALEQRLRETAQQQALPHSSKQARGSRRWRIALPAATAIGLTAAALVVLASNGTSTSAAYGKPRILLAEPVSAPQVVAQLQEGMSVKLALGAEATLQEARSVPAFGGTAYVVTGDAGWCLAAPDPAMPDVASANPARSGVVTCARTADVYRYGLYLGVGNNFIVALPDNAKPPTLRSPRGQARPLEPDEHGVVIGENVESGSTLTVYGPDDSTRSIKLR